MNKNLRIVEGNSKLEKSEDAAFLIFNLPAIITCPWATTVCKNICYAKYEEIRYETARESRQANLDESKRENFVKDMIERIEYELKRRKYKNKKIYFRFHSSGDVYNQEYANRIIQIVDHFKGNEKISFTMYTKSIRYFKNYDINNINIKILYSIMSDTKYEEIEIAKSLGLQTYEAKKEKDIKENETICDMNCKNCKKCYERENTGNIVVAIHGNGKNK